MVVTILSNDNSVFSDIVKSGKVKPYGFDKVFMDKDLIEDNLYQIIDQFNE